MLPAAKTQLYPVNPLEFLTYFIQHKYNKIPPYWSASQFPFLSSLIFFLNVFYTVTFPKEVLQGILQK